MREPITILIVNQLEACLARVLAVRRTSSRIMVLRADKRTWAGDRISSHAPHSWW